MKVAVARLVVGILVLAGCARPGAQPGADPKVPADCLIDQAEISWTGIAVEPVLTRVRVQPSYHSDPEAPHPSWMPPSATTVRDEPVVPAVRGRTVPASWLPALARSLHKASGKRVHTETANPEYGNQIATIVNTYGDLWPAIVFYAGVQQISAAFTVGCSPPVPGTLLAWTTSSAGNVSCDLVNSGPNPPMGRLAMRYCPNLVTPEPS